MSKGLSGQPFAVVPVTASAPDSNACSIRCAHSGAASQSSSVKHTKGSCAARTPSLRAAATPPASGRRTSRAPVPSTTRATESGWGEPSSTTTISMDSTAVCRSSAASDVLSRSGRPCVGMTTDSLSGSVRTAPFGSGSSRRPQAEFSSTEPLLRAFRLVQKKRLSDSVELPTTAGWVVRRAALLEVARDQGANGEGERNDRRVEDHSRQVMAHQTRLRFGGEGGAAGGDSADRAQWGPAFSPVEADRIWEQCRPRPTRSVPFARCSRSCM